MNYYFILITLFSFLNILFSDDSVFIVKGKVIDSESLIPLEKAEVYNIGTKEGVITDSLGNFILRKSISGLNKIHFSYIGYSDIIKEIIVPSNKKLIIKMSPDNVIVDPISVTGVYLERPLSNSPVITEVISNKEIERFSNTTLIGLLEKAIPNIQIVNDSHGTTMKIQGLDSKYFLFLIDGNRMTGETTGNIDFSRLNLNDIERIEIVNGGASASYGSGAIGGVINIITKEGDSPFSVNFGTKMYSKNSDVNHFLSAKIKYKNLSSNSSLSYKGSGGYYRKYDPDLKTYSYYENDDIIDGDIVQNTFNDISFNQSLKYKLNKKLNLYFSGLYYQHDTDDYNYNNKRRDKYYDKQYVLKIDYLIESYSANLNINFNSDNYEKFTLFEVLDEERIRSRHQLNLFNLNFSKKINDNYIVLGYENYNESFYSPSDLDYNPFAGYLGSDSLKSSILNSIFFQSEFYFSEKIQLVSGFRYDDNSIFGSHFGPHISAMYKNDNLLYRLNISKNFRSPSLKELYMSWDHLGMFYVRGNKNLLPEKSEYISGSIEYSKSKFNLTIKPYFYYILNMIVMVENLDNNEMINQNVGSVHIPGLDIYAKMILGEYIRLSSTISITDPKDIVNNIQVDGSNKIAISNMVSIYNNNHSFNINYKYLSSTFYSYKNPINEYFILNLSYNFKFNNIFNFTFGVDNYLNTIPINENLTLFPNRRYFANISFNLFK